MSDKITGSERLERMKSDQLWLTKLQLEVETMIINTQSSRVTADEIVQLVMDTVEGKREPKDSKPWAKFAVGKPLE